MSGQSHKLISGLALLCLAGFQPHAALAASFDCGKAKGVVEKAICADAVISEYDEALGRYYAVALESLADGGVCLKEDQKRWIKKVRNVCKADAACLTAAYLARLAALDGLQPGASALKNVELPRGPVLMTAIPPEADFAPASSSKSFEARGHLAHEGSDINNMGFAVKTKTGQARAFVLDMSIGNSPAHEVVRGLIELDADANFLVRGTLGDEGGFADGACRFVYRLPE